MLALGEPKVKLLNVIGVSCSGTSAFGSNGTPGVRAICVTLLTCPPHCYREWGLFGPHVRRPFFGRHEEGRPTDIYSFSGRSFGKPPEGNR